MPLRIETYQDKNFPQNPAVMFNTGTDIQFEYVDKDNAPENVQQYIFGFQNFDLSYGNTDRKIQYASVFLTNTYSTGNLISTNINAQLQDDDGNLLDLGSSGARLVGIAWTGTPPSNSTLLRTQSFPTGGCTPDLPLTGTNPTVLQAIMTGFDVSYGSSAQEVLSLSLSLNATSAGSQATIGGFFSMADASGHISSEASLTAGLLASTGRSRGFVVVSSTIMTQNGQLQWTTIDFKGAIADDLGVPDLSGYSTVALSEVGAVITGFSIEYPGDDYEVQAISVGCWDENLVIQGTTVSAYNVGAWMYDDSGDLQAGQSSVTMAFIATYTAT